MKMLMIFCTAPGASPLVLLTVDEADAAKVLKALEQHRGHCAPGEGFHAVQLPVEKVLAGAHDA